MKGRNLFLTRYDLSFFVFLSSLLFLVLFLQANTAVGKPDDQGKPDTVQINKADTVRGKQANKTDTTALSKPDTTITGSTATSSPDTAIAKGDSSAAGKHEEQAESHPVDTVKLGERFFKGFLPHRTSQPACVSCHNLTAVDSLNWNPSAREIAVKYLGKTTADLKAVVLQPDGGMMAKVHQGYKYEDADMRAVKAYLDDLAMHDPIHEKPNVNRLLLFVFLSALVIWALLELIFFRKIKYKFIPVIVITVVISYQLKMLYDEGVRLGRAQGYEPMQPIKFSHKVHAEQNQIDCKYCHYTAETSKLAGIPPADLCLNCHSLVREGTRSGKFEIAKIIEANEKHIPIKWIRIHNLPDFVFFSHAQHVNAGKLDCLECHGEVEKMDVVRQVNDLSMGWCLDCHRTREVQFIDNNFYGQYKELHEKIKKGQIDRVTVAMTGGTDCIKCHY